jgi:hypothetical protein
MRRPRDGAVQMGAAWIAAVYLTVGTAADFQTLELSALDEALRIARTRRPAELDTFTAPYLIVRGGPGQPSVEVITEFRRAVILARQQVDAGNYTWSPTNLSKALAKYSGLTVIRAEVWLPPVHMFVSTPAYRMDLFYASHRMVASIEEKREPIYSTLLSETTPSLAGVSLEWTYRAEVVKEQGCCVLVLVDSKGETVVKQQIPFDNLR